MSHHEAKYLASFLITLPLAIAYALHVQSAASGGAMAGPEAGATAGRAILILIGIMVAAGIAGQIALHIGRSLLGQEVEWREDERDRLIEHRATAIVFRVFSAGFLGSLVGLSLGWAPVLVLHLTTGAMLVAGLAGDAARLWLYRRLG
ncbi:MAG: hypothetical protein ACK4L4_02160 [Gemmobacter sp.]